MAMELPKQGPWRTPYSGVKEIWDSAAHHHYKVRAFVSGSALFLQGTPMRCDRDSICERSTTT